MKPSDNQKQIKVQKGKKNHTKILAKQLYLFNSSTRIQKIMKKLYKNNIN